MGKQTIADRLRLRNIMKRIRPEAEVGFDVPRPGKKPGIWARFKIKLRF